MVSAGVLLPLAWAAVSAIKPLDEVYEFPPSFGVDEPQWSNFAEVFTRLPLARFLWNSVFLTTVCTIGSVLTTSMAGYALARLEFRGRSACLWLVIVSLFIPAPMLLLPRFMLCSALGWIGTYKPLIVPAWLATSGFSVLLFRQFFRNIPRTVDDAARLDGASAWQVYWHVLLPAARPATVAAVMLSAVHYWRDFLDPLVYLTDFRTFPVSVGLRMFQSLAGTYMNLLMAASLVAMAPVAVLFLVCERWVLDGLSGAYRSRSHSTTDP